LSDARVPDPHQLQRRRAKSQRMMGRVDQAIYQISVAEMLNFVPTIEGRR
jgi:hypothetical protein